MVEPAQGLSLNVLRTYAADTLGSPETELPQSFLEVVNQAGHFLATVHPWSWFVRRHKVLKLRGRVTFEDATWTESTLQIRSTGAFADYVWAQGDLLDDTDGTGAIVDGQFEIAARIDDDTIQLRTSLSEDGTDLVTGDLSGTIDVVSVELPSDFVKIYSLMSKNSLTFHVAMTDLETFLRYRTNEIFNSSSFFYATKIYATFPDDTGGAPVPMLDIWPPLSSGNDQDAFTMYYQGGWRDLTNDDDYVPIPSWMHLCFIQLVRLMIRGYEEEDEGPMSERLLEWMQAPYTIAAMGRDGNEQQHLGVVRGGIADSDEVNNVFSIGNSSVELGP